MLLTVVERIYLQNVLEKTERYSSPNLKNELKRILVTRTDEDSSSRTEETVPDVTRRDIGPFYIVNLSDLKKKKSLYPC